MMRFLIDNWGTIGTAVTGLWGFYERRKANQRVKATQKLLTEVSDIATRYADALARGDLKTMRLIEKERIAKGL